MQQTNSKYVIYRHVITGSYPVFETNDKKEAIRFYQIDSLSHHQKTTAGFRLLPRHKATGSYTEQ